MYNVKIPFRYISLTSLLSKYIVFEMSWRKSRDARHSIWLRELLGTHSHANIPENIFRDAFKSRGESIEMTFREIKPLLVKFTSFAVSPCT